MRHALDIRCILAFSASEKDATAGFGFEGMVSSAIVRPGADATGICKL